MGWDGQFANFTYFKIDPRYATFIVTSQIFLSKAKLPPFLLPRTSMSNNHLQVTQQTTVMVLFILINAKC